MSRTRAEQLAVVLGHMDRLGYVRCTVCQPNPPAGAVPMTEPNLCNLDDECDGCHLPLIGAAA